MKIILYGINFAPELTGIGKYTGELAEWLSKAGHAVSVITAPPYYPQWNVQPGHSAYRYSVETWSGVHVHRAPLWVPPKPGGLARLAHLASFALASLPTLIRCALKRPDLILVVAPALFCAPAAVLAARLCGARAWLHMQDYEVDAAFDLGLLKGQLLRRMVRGAESWLMRRFDRVSTISERMLGLASRKGVSSEKLVSMPNWIDLNAIAPLPSPSPIRTELGIGAADVVALYSGNMGGKQGLETLASLAYLLRRNQNIHFIFCGQGHQREALRAQCATLPNVRFLDLQPIERLNDLLNAADIHLLPQRKGAADLVMPSKLTGMLASGRPVVCGAAPDTELAGVVNHCGVVVAPENARQMARAVKRLALDPVKRRALGQAARAYAVQHLNIETILTRFEQDAIHCVAAAAPARSKRAAP